MPPRKRPTDQRTPDDVVVVHSSDLHVDDSYTARAYGGDGNGPLRCVLDAAQEVSASVVLLTGDIFEHNRLPLELLDKTARILEDVVQTLTEAPAVSMPQMAESAAQIAQARITPKGRRIGAICGAARAVKTGITAPRKM